MKKLLLCLVPGVAFFLTVSAQSNLSSKILLSYADTSGRNELRAQRITPDTKKAIQNPAYSFKDLFESNGLGIAASGGPRLNPRAVTFVKDYIDKNGRDLTKLKTWGLPFFNMMDGILLQNNLPRELKYLAVIESRLNPASVSWAGAVGPWQFMPSTAIQLGLKVNRYVDERTNYIKSTEAAAKYLTKLYDQFGDWLLVIAAYNGGPGNVLKAIKKSGSRNFWDIQYFLPAESRNHVKKFIGTHYVFEGQGGLTTLTKAESENHYGVKGSFAINRNLTQEELTSAKGLVVTGKYHSTVIAKYLNMDVSDFNRYNPSFDKLIVGKKGNYDMQLPADKMELFLAHKYKILNESIQLLLTNASFTADESAKVQ